MMGKRPRLSVGGWLLILTMPLAAATSEDDGLHACEVDVATGLSWSAEREKFEIARFAPDRFILRQIDCDPSPLSPEQQRAGATKACYTLKSTTNDIAKSFECIVNTMSQAMCTTFIVAEDGQKISLRDAFEVDLEGGIFVLHLAGSVPWFKERAEQGGGWYLGGEAPSWAMSWYLGSGKCVPF